MSYFNPKSGQEYIKFGSDSFNKWTGLPKSDGKISDTIKLEKATWCKDTCAKNSKCDAYFLGVWHQQYGWLYCFNVKLNDGFTYQVNANAPYSAIKIRGNSTIFQELILLVASRKFIQLTEMILETEI